MKYLALVIFLFNFSLSADMTKLLNQEVGAFQARGNAGDILKILKLTLDNKINFFIESGNDQFDEHEIDKEFDVNLKNIKVYEILNKVSEISGLLYRHEENCICFYLRSDQDSNLTFRHYRVSNLSKILEKNFTQFLELNGISIPEKGKAVYLPQTALIFMLNSEFEHEKLQKVLDRKDAYYKLQKLNDLFHNNRKDVNNAGTLQKIKELQQIIAETKPVETLNVDTSYKSLKASIKVDKKILPQILEEVRKVYNLKVEFQGSRDFSNKEMTFDFTNIKFLDLMDILGKSCEFEYKLLKDKILIMSPGKEINIISGTYPYSALVLDLFDDFPESTKYKERFRQLGIKFGPGAKIRFGSRTMQMVIFNTAEEHKKIKEIFDTIYDFDTSEK